MDFEFVNQIGKDNFSPEMLTHLRRHVVRGSHKDIILQEALLDRDYPLDIIQNIIQSVNNDSIMCSFPDHRYEGKHLLFRSEFLLLGYAGNGRLNLKNDRYKIIESTREIIRRAKPASIIYRLCDYNDDDFSFLDIPKSKTRGAERLLCSDGILELDLTIICDIIQSGVEISILVPCLRFADEFNHIKAIIKKELGRHEMQVNGYGVMLEVPANLYEIDGYRSADYFIFGPGDLIKYFYGDMDRNHPSSSHANQSVILKPIRGCLEQINLWNEPKKVYLAKSLINMHKEYRQAQLNNITFSNLYLPSQIMAKAMTHMAS